MQPPLVMNEQPVVDHVKLAASAPLIAIEGEPDPGLFVINQLPGETAMLQITVFGATGPVNPVCGQLIEVEGGVLGAVTVIVIGNCVVACADTERKQPIARARKTLHRR